MANVGYRLYFLVLFYATLVTCNFNTSILSGPFKSQASGTFQYESLIYHKKLTVYRERLKFPPSNKVIVKYYISLETSKCCPIIWIEGHENMGLSGHYWGRGCLPNVLKEPFLYSGHFIIVDPDFNPGCKHEGMRTVCNGTRTLTHLKTFEEWVLGVDYECRIRQNIDLYVKADIQYMTDFTYTCEPIKTTFCTDYLEYSTTTFPNAAIQQSQTEAIKFLDSLLGTRDIYAKCYQHALLLACRTLLPECHNEKRIFPCRIMCEVWLAECGKFLGQYPKILDCAGLPQSLDPDVCFYKPVVCPPPGSLQFGSVIVEGQRFGNTSRYQCDDGYELKGDSVLQCKASGHWNASTPTCESPAAPTPVVFLSHGGTLSIAVLIPAVLLIIIAMVCVLYRHNIKIFILFNRYNNCFSVRNQEQKILFIAYSGQDNDEVSNNFVPILRQQLKGWTVQTYQDDFTAGRPILDCIKEGVWESHAVLVLLTNNFMTSAWCLHEFIEAETRSALDDGFKLIVVMFTQDNQGLPVELLEGLPDSLKRYIRTRIYLGLWEPLFWNKLQQGLAS